MTLRLTLGLLLSCVIPAFAGQAPGTANSPDIAISHRDRFVSLGNVFSSSLHVCHSPRLLGGARPEAKLGGARISRCILPLRELLCSRSTRRAAPGPGDSKARRQRRHCSWPYGRGDSSMKSSVFRPIEPAVRQVELSAEQPLRAHSNNVADDHRTGQSTGGRAASSRTRASARTQDRPSTAAISRTG
jgi:hypothetical protein